MKRIDYFRIIAAILVIAIHTSPLSSISKTGDMVFTGILARVAVPFFFMATGFFLFPTDSKNQMLTGKKEGCFSYKRFLVKSLKLYGLAIVLFLPLGIYAGHFLQKPFFSELFKDLVFNGTFYHLWYFPAVILGVGIVFQLTKHLPDQTALLVTFALYVIGLFGDSYYGFSAQIPFLRGFYHILFQCFDYTRNGLFFAPFYLMLGIYLSKRKPSSQRHCMLGFSASLVLLISEGLFLHLYSQPRHDSMYFSLIFCMYFLFQLLVDSKAPAIPAGSDTKMLRTISLLLYIIHPWCIVLVRGFAKMTHGEEIMIQNSVLFFVLVTLLSASLSILGSMLWSQWKRFALKSAGKRVLDKKGRAWAEIDLSNLRFNLAQLKAVLPQGCEVMAVVKADAYGHGAVPVASALQDAGVKAFAVATMEEGILLRKKAVKGTILILGYTHPEKASQLTKYRLTQTVVDRHYAEALNQYGKKIKVHLKIDTGMHRLGEDHGHLSEILSIFQLSNLVIEGMYTHLCVSDSPLEEDRHYTTQQIESFYQVADYLKEKGYTPPSLHIQSSYGILNYPELRCSYARMGIALYGALSQANDKTKVSITLKPVLSIKARVAVVKALACDQSVGYGAVALAFKKTLVRSSFLYGLLKFKMIFMQIRRAMPKNCAL